MRSLCRRSINQATRMKGQRLHSRSVLDAVGHKHQWALLPGTPRLCESAKRRNKHEWRALDVLVAAVHEAALQLQGFEGLQIHWVATGDGASQGLHTLLNGERETWAGHSTQRKVVPHKVMLVGTVPSPLRPLCPPPFPPLPCMLPLVEEAARTAHCVGGNCGGARWGAQPRPSGGAPCPHVDHNVNRHKKTG